MRGRAGGGNEQKKKKREKELRDMDNGVVITGRGVEVVEGIGGINGDEKNKIIIK